MIGRGFTSGTTAKSVYAAIPVSFDEGFATYHGEAEPIVLVWLVPLMEPEARYVKSHGWESFEDILEASQANLFDPGRPSLIFP